MATPEFRPTHVVPQDGLPAWEAPDVSRPTEPLDALLPVQLLDRRGDWGRILCANGWSAWVDGRLLVSVPQDPPAAGRPLARTADPRPLIARVEESLRQYRRAAEELAAGHLDGEGFHQRTRGLRVGMVVDGEAVWLYDAEHERWVYCDGTRLSTYAAAAGPGLAVPGAQEEPQAAASEQPRPAAPEATQVVDPALLAPPGEETRPVPTADDTGGAPEAPGVPAPEATQVVDPAKWGPHAPTKTPDGPGTAGDGDR